MSKHHKDQSAYFEKLSNALKSEGLLRPTLVIDEERLEKNTATLLSHLPEGMGFRVVIKSLPSIPLAKKIMEQAKTEKLMVFDLSFLPAIAKELPESDVLFGKPMPVALVRRFYESFHEDKFDPSKQVQWLIDTPERLKEYADFAEERGLNLKVNIEIDIGLHRGGAATPGELKKMLQEIDAHPRLSFSGLMGYDAHIPKVPGFMQGRALKKSRAIYEEMRKVAEDHYPDRRASLTFNTGGSPTYKLHRNIAAGNEVAVGSGLVKPLDFDVPTLADHEPACFIATPVLKVEEKTKLPGIEALSGLAAAFNPKSAKALFIFGGNWQAEPVWPEGLQNNKLFGRSSNEEMLNAPKTLDLKPDDIVFLRPTQSEFVFLQFGDIAVYRDGKITQFWPVIDQSAKHQQPKNQPKPG